MPITTSARRARGPIIVSRHGKPALDRTAGPPLEWREYVEWWSRYEQGALANGQAAPDSLKEIVADANIVFASFSPGTGEPQVVQNHFCQCVPGLVHVATRSRPPTQRNRSVGNTTTAIPCAPVDRRQIEQ